MKIDRKTLKKIIKEELAYVIKENSGEQFGYNKNDPDFNPAALTFNRGAAINFLKKNMEVLKTFNSDLPEYGSDSSLSPKDWFEILSIATNITIETKKYWYEDFMIADSDKRWYEKMEEIVYEEVGEKIEEKGEDFLDLRGFHVLFGEAGMSNLDPTTNFFEIIVMTFLRDNEYLDDNFGRQDPMDHPHYNQQHAQSYDYWPEDERI